MSIILNHVGYEYGGGTVFEKKALRDVSLQIGDGEFIGVIGHTGSGKSTLVQLLNGLLKATEGGVYFNGQDVSDKDFSLKELRGKVGLVFQYPEHQLFETSVIEDVRFGPRNLGLPNLEVDLRAYDALKQVGVGEDLLDASPLELSGGQKRRVAIAGVLAMKPEVLVLDEPTAGLDPRGRDEVLELLARLHSEGGVTVILVSHRMEDVAKYAERVIVLNEGEMFADGSPKEVFGRRRELERIGLSVPQANYVMWALREKGFDVRVDVANTEEAVAEVARVVQG